jgi:NAD(P)-dependent dehydrogenase (short-subunit alcohol dehydrogenase family)
MGNDNGYQCKRHISFLQRGWKGDISQGKGGKVCLLGSARGDLGMANYSGYSPSKGAVHLLAKTLGCEWGQYGINVNAIAPNCFQNSFDPVDV